MKEKLIQLIAEIEETIKYCETQLKRNNINPVERGAFINTKSRESILLTKLKAIIATEEDKSEDC